MGSFNPSNIQRLQEAQEKSLQNCREKILQWEKFRKDYNKLKDKLKTLPDKLTHDVMVPFGSVAYMPGKLVHTNEIMVLLGDNWFAERSASQAVEIVGRRIAQCDSVLEGLRNEQKQFETWKDYTARLQNEADGEGVREIVEEYDEEHEKLWREKHKQNIVKDRQQQRKVGHAKSGELTISDQEFWDRLDELHMQEIENCETSMHEKTTSEAEKTCSRNDAVASTSSDRTTELKRVRWKNDLIASDDQAKSSRTPKDVPNIQSPADIYKHFGLPANSDPPKSSLKKSSSPQETSPNSPVLTKTIVEPISAFSGVIVESEPANTAVERFEETNAPTKMSKFKARRQVCRE